jgi:hypothetical protein
VEKLERKEDKKEEIEWAGGMLQQSTKVQNYRE